MAKEKMTGGLTKGYGKGMKHDHTGDISHGNANEHMGTHSHDPAIHPSHHAGNKEHMTGNGFAGPDEDMMGPHGDNESHC